MSVNTSAAWFEKFARRAGWRAGDIHDDQRLRVANALVGMARAAMRGLSGDREDPTQVPAVDEAIRWTDEAEDYCRDQAREGYALAASHAKAMRGLLLRKRASLEKDDSPDKLDFLRQAEVALRESYEERQTQFSDPVTHPELDRSQFNLAGLEIRLAQADSADRSAEHLAEALRHYTEVLEIRLRRYRTDELEEVACCVNGQAIAVYYQAVLLKGTWAEKAGQLRSAARHAGEAVAIRQALAGTADDVNTSKSLVLQAKIALARLAVMEAARIRGDRDEQALTAYQKEKWKLLDQHEEEE